MTRDEVRVFIGAELSRIGAEAAIGGFVANDDKHPAVLWMRKQGSQEAATEVQRLARSDPAGIPPFLDRWRQSVIERLAFDVCLRLAEPHQRTIVAIRDALEIPR